MSRYYEVKKLTTELRKGDIITDGDCRDRVVDVVQEEGSYVLRVNLLRNGKKTFRYAGTHAVHTVEVMA